MASSKHPAAIVVLIYKLGLLDSDPVRRLYAQINRCFNGIKKANKDC